PRVCKREPLTRLAGARHPLPQGERVSPRAAPAHILLAPTDPCDLPGAANRPRGPGFHFFPLPSVPTRLHSDSAFGPTGAGNPGFPAARVGRSAACDSRAAAGRPTAERNPAGADHGPVPPPAEGSVPGR